MLNPPKTHLHINHILSDTELMETAVWAVQQSPRLSQSVHFTSTTIHGSHSMHKGPHVRSTAIKLPSSA